MSLNFIKIDKDTRTASVGIHHYTIEGDYYNGWEVFYATGVAPPSNGKAWSKVASGGSVGKCVGPANRHFKNIKDQSK